jgi:hypothetical protein
MQSGLYVDYIIKKLSEIFIKNVFVYSSIFFGEKFIIEFLSKKILNNLTFVVNSYFLNKEYSYITFYNNLIIISILSFTFIELYIIFYII